MDQLGTNFMNRKGSALMQVLATLAMMGAITVSVLAVNSQQQQTELRVRQKTDVDGFVTLVSSLLASPDVCRELLVFATNNKKPHMPSLAGAGQGMSICVPSKGIVNSVDPLSSQMCGNEDWFPKVGHVADVTYSPDEQTFNSQLLVQSTDDLYSVYRPQLFLDVQQIRFVLDKDLDPNPVIVAQQEIYKGKLDVLVEPNEEGASAVNWRTVVSNFEITYDTETERIESCGAGTTTESLCKQMGCSWDANATIHGKCVCGFAHSQCPAGKILKGVSKSGALTCEDFNLSCENEDEVAVGFDGAKLICQKVGQWFTTAWSPCGPGGQNRIVKCVSVATPSRAAALTAKELDPSYCPDPKPSDTRPMSAGVCVAVVDGQCNLGVQFACASGAIANTKETDTDYTWDCRGSNGGKNDSCSFAKVAEPPPDLNVIFYGLSGLGGGAGRAPVPLAYLTWSNPTAKSCQGIRTLSSGAKETFTNSTQGYQRFETGLNGNKFELICDGVTKVWSNVKSAVTGDKCQPGCQVIRDNKRFPAVTFNNGCVSDLDRTATCPTAHGLW